MVANWASGLPPAVQIRGKMAATLATMASMVECHSMKGMEEGHNGHHGRTQLPRWPLLPHGCPPKIPIAHGHQALAAILNPMACRRWWPSWPPS